MFPALITMTVDLMESVLSAGPAGSIVPYGSISPVYLLNVRIHRLRFPQGGVSQLSQRSDRAWQYSELKKIETTR